MTTANDLRITEHAKGELLADRITDADILSVINTGVVIEDYANDYPLPSCLSLGWSAGRPVHVCWARVPNATTVIIITGYVCDPTRWEADFRTRRTP